MGKTILQPTTMIGYSSNGSWIKFIDGTLIQFGSISIPENEGMKTITFPIPFVNVNYSTSVVGYFSYTNDTVYSIAGKSSSSISVYKHTADTHVQPFEWIAIGRWK